MKGAGNGDARARLFARQCRCSTRGDHRTADRLGGRTQALVVGDEPRELGLELLRGGEMDRVERVRCTYSVGRFGSCLRGGAQVASVFPSLEVCLFWSLAYVVIRRVLELVVLFGRGDARRSWRSSCCAMSCRSCA